MKIMNGKRYTQWGIVLMALLFPSLIYFLILLVRLETINILFYIYFLMCVVFLFALLCFHRLTISIDNTYVSFKLGIGLINKRYKIKNIKSCKPVSYSILRGFGIRIFPNGILYNVSGVKAIELQFYDRKKIVQIGTNQPEEITHQINSLIGGEKITSYLPTNQERKLQEFILAMILLLIIIFIGAIGAIRDNVVDINNEELIIKGIHGFSIPLSEINQVDTISSISWHGRTGYYFPHTIKAQVTQSNGKRMMVFLKTKYKPFIFIQLHGNKEPICLNFRDRQKTINLYNQLKKKNNGTSD